MNTALAVRTVSTGDEPSGLQFRVFGNSLAGRCASPDSRKYEPAVRFIRSGLDGGDGTATRYRLVLDVCGVLLHDPMKELFRAVARDTTCSEDRVESTFTQRFRHDLWSGRIGEQEFWVHFTAVFGGHRPSAWREVVMSAMTPLPAVRRLPLWSRRADIWLLSNHRHEWLVPALRNAGVLPHACRAFISSQTGHVKPDAAAYLDLLERAEPGDHLLYVDDKDANVSACRRFGVDAIQADLGGGWMSAVDAWLGIAARNDQ